MQCPNCKAEIGCRCQLTTYPNRKTVCIYCKSTYEASLTKKTTDDQTLTLQQKINLKTSG